MKKFLFMIALICAVVNVSAQENSKWSVKSGIGLTNVVGSDAEGAKSALSYKVGVGYEFSISDKFAIEPSLMLSNKAFKMEEVDGTVNRFYVELPVLAAYKFELNNGNQLVFNAGPYAAFGLFGSDIEWYGYGESNIFDACEKFEAGVQIGIKMGFGNWFVGADFTRALTKTIKDSKTYNQGFGITFGYNF